MNLWKEKDIPHKGWYCHDVIDLGYGNYSSCEMCGNERIRFVHTMKHPYRIDNPVLEVGCVCAEKMTDDYVKPKEREKALRNKSKRKETWMKKSWPMSRKGNYYLNHNGDIIIIFETRERLFGILVNKHFSSKRFTSYLDAKEEAFEFYNQIKEKENVHTV